MALLWIPLISCRTHYLRCGVTLDSLATPAFFPSLDHAVPDAPQNRLLPRVTAEEENPG